MNDLDRKLRRLHSAAFDYFMCVAAEGSFRGAARRLRVAPSAINRHILLLEEELGSALFERRGRALRLSSAGEVVLKHCKATLRSFEDAIEDLDALRDLRRGIVRVAASESFAAEIVPAICADFTEQYPGIHVHVTVAESNAVIASLEHGECDVGFAFGRVRSKPVRTLADFDLPIGAVVGPRHPLAKRRRVSIAECFRYPVITPDAKLSFRQCMDEVTGQFQTRTAAGVEASSPRLMIGIARLNRHVAFQTKIGIAGDMATGALVFLPLTDRGLKHDNCVLAVGLERDVRFAAQEFCSFAASAMGRMLGTSGGRALKGLAGPA